MENKNFLKKMVENLKENISIKNIFGAPIETKGKTIIPVAQLSFGMGGGSGTGKRDDEEESSDITVENVSRGGGGGGGGSAKPKGVYEITEEETRFIPVQDRKQLFLAGITGFTLCYLFFRRRKK